MTMRPYPWSTMCGQAARVVLNDPVTCTARCRVEIVHVGLGEARPTG